jgi:hypothetical protein
MIHMDAAVDIVAFLKAENNARRHSGFMPVNSAARERETIFLPHT